MFTYSKREFYMTYTYEKATYSSICIAVVLEIYWGNQGLSDESRAVYG